MNTYSPLITIIIPSYNSEGFINQTLLSVANQTYTKWQCIVINDGSTDHSLDRIKAWSVKDNRFTYYTQNNKGLSATRNRGLELAKGDYVYFLDADDTITTDCLSVLVQNASPINDIIVGKIATIKNNVIESELQHPKEGTINFINHKQEILIRTISKGLTPVAQNRLYKISFLKNNQLFFKEGIVHEDELWFFETNFFAQNVLFVNHFTYLYLVDNTNSITNKIKDKNLSDMLLVIQSIYQDYYLKLADTYQKAITGKYILYLIKNILDLAIKNKNVFTEQAIQTIAKSFKDITINDTVKILSKDNERYYKAINSIKSFPFKKIESLFFKNPVNSIRKKIKLLIIELLYC